MAKTTTTTTTPARARRAALQQRIDDVSALTGAIATQDHVIATLSKAVEDATAVRSALTAQLKKAMDAWVQIGSGRAAVSRHGRTVDGGVR